MSYLLVCITALVVAGLTLFSGFGLGTLLMPAFAVFFPVEIAVAATAIVHLANNLFKLLLIGRWASWPVVSRFAPTAAGFALVGALLLNQLSGLPPVLTYTLRGGEHEVTLIKLVIAALIAGFTLLELVPSTERFSIDDRLLPLGGALSGFFGGLSGHQGALRTAFLVRAGLNKKSFLGTIAVCAVAVDVSRLIVYGATFFSGHLERATERGGGGLVAAATFAAFIGTFVGTRLVEKVALRSVHQLVGALLFAFAVALGAGLL